MNFFSLNSVCLLLFLLFDCWSLWQNHPSSEKYTDLNGNDAMFNWILRQIAQNQPNRSWKLNRQQHSHEQWKRTFTVDATVLLHLCSHLRIVCAYLNPGQWITKATHYVDGLTNCKRLTWIQTIHLQTCHFICIDKSIFVDAFQHPILFSLYSLSLCFE